MRITTTKYLKAYQQNLGFDLREAFHAIDFSDRAIDLDYRIKASAVFSSNIEGNTVDLNSFMNYYELNYDKSLPFLMMLPKALTEEKNKT